ncbi:MAG: M48 family metalloprotease [bacterium]
MPFFSPRGCRARSLVAAVTACCLTFSPIALNATSIDELPDIGSASGNILSPGEEKRLGKAFMRYIQATEAVVDDTLMEDYISRLGKNLVSHSEGQGSHFEFFLIDDPSINAFAGPYGYIGVNTGLITTTDSESELAAVLAHEISHVTQRHLFRAWHASESMSFAQAAIILAAIALGAAAGGEAALAAASVGQAAVAQGQINFTRANEKEADRIGIQILADSGFEPRAMPSFFSRMGRANQLYATTLPEFLLTHPVTTSRISDSLGRAEAFPHRQHEEDIRYHLTRAAIKERSFDLPEDAVDYFSKTLEDGRYRRLEADQYGYVLALTRNRQLKQAREINQSLLVEYPNVLEFTIASARIDAAEKKLERAIETLEKALPRFPLSYPLLVDLSSFYLRNDQPQQAYKILNNLSFRRPADTRVYKLIAQASADLKDPVKSHEYLGLHYYFSGALKPAELQLKIALKQNNIDQYDTARIQSRLNAIRAEIAALEAEQRKR